MKAIENLKFLTKGVLSLFIFLLLNNFSFSQNTDNEKIVAHFSGNISATNNGISLIPSFSLGKPALMFELSMGGEKLSFDPQFRFSMEGKPWSFVFWWRYKMIENQKFQLRVGAHPAFLFSTPTYYKDGNPVEVLKASRFVAAEVAPSFQITKNISFNSYYLVGHGFDPGIRNSHYIALISSFSNLGITEHIHGSITPQVFYLKMDDLHGYYFASNFSLAHDKFPVSLAAMINKKLKSDIASKDFLWNLSLVYTFSNKYKKL